MKKILVLLFAFAVLGIGGIGAVDVHKIVGSHSICPA